MLLTAVYTQFTVYNNTDFMMPIKNNFIFINQVVITCILT